ncbi:hypothetical protein BHE74_00007049 [Ensete ventricosum]|nr:hypothetical protein BHE74_00007049 [Ensete ventricosum]RZR85493.1 hypothetical protein BHM03_00012488 [Ensete ventricosum]
MEAERVQVIASVCAANGAMPPEFIRSEHEQPGITTFRGPAPEIPVIDLAVADQDHLTIAVAEASREWGIFQLLNHGIPEEVLRELQRVGKEFFELPQEEKEMYAMDYKPESSEGYGTKLQKELEGKKAWVDFFFHYLSPPARVNHAIWPKKPADYR